MPAPPSPDPEQRYAVYSAVNQRENNEDSFQIFTLSPAIGHPPITILAVADGMGGHDRGEEFSRLALEKLSQTLCDPFLIATTVNQRPQDIAIAPEALGSALAEATRQANHYIQRLREKNGWKKGGSTLVVAAILGDRAIATNLGDSPLLHYSARTDTLTQRTTDHTLTNALLQADIITPEMAVHHSGRNQLRYYIGCDKLPDELPIYELDLEPGDLLLLCSDGISGTLSPATIQQILTQTDLSLSQRSETLAQQAIAAGETDNQTLILWQH